MPNYTPQLFERGSEWRKWDLHIHTPLSIVQEYGGDIEEVWEKFITALENLPKEVRVIGINDYYFVDGYEKVMKFKNKGRLQNLDKIFPILEFRIDTFASASENKLQKVNLHVLFDIDENNLSEEIRTIKEEFIGNIHLSSEHNTELLSIQNLTNKSSDGKLKTGFEELIPETKEVFKIIESDQWRNKTFIFLGYSEWNNLEKRNQLKPKKRMLYEKADAFFTASETDNTSKKEEVLYAVSGQFKPLMHSLDIHKFDQFKQGNYKCLTWIKSDPTFEGLKQIINEPHERVFLGDEPDKLVELASNSSRYIDSIKIFHTDNKEKSGWFYNEIPLNSGLVAIIGRKGQGKSALTDIIAFCGKTKIASSDYPFLRRDKFRKKDLAKNYNATLKWWDETSVTENLNSEVSIVEVEKVKYLPQKHVETICNDDGVSAAFQQEIDEVIFSYIPEESRLDATNLRDLVNIKTEAIDANMIEIRNDIHLINEKVVKLEGKKHPEYLESLNKKLVEKQKELKGLVRPKYVPPPKTKLKKKDQDRLDKLEKEIKKITGEINSAKTALKTTNEKINKLNKLKGAVDKLTEGIDKIIRDFSDDAKFLSIDLSELLSVRIDNEILLRAERKLLNQRTSLEELLDQSDKPSSKSLYIKKTKFETQKTKIIGVLSEDQRRYSAYKRGLEEYEKQKNKIEGDENDLSLETIRSVESEIDYLKKGINIDLETAIADKASLVEKLYSELLEKLDFYKEIYRPLLRFIETEKNTQKKSGSILGFDAGIVFNRRSFPEKFLSYVNQSRGGSFQYITQGQKILDGIIERVNFVTVEGAKEFISELIEHLQYDKTKTPEKENILRDQLKGGEKENIDFYDFVFGLGYLDVKHKVLFGGKDLNSNEFSPGEKGALLLIFYLLIDKERIPLIMDQPEENLDNESVYELLVPYIRKVKLKRQIIIVTHNPNIAVVCDAEQIIAASMDKKKSQIRYTSGSIENPEINKRAADVLEGTLPAFDIRDDKYIRK